MRKKSLDISGTSCSSLTRPHQVFYRHCARPPSLLQFWRCAPEEDVLVQDQFDGGEDVEGVVHHQGLSYVPEIIRLS